MTSNQKRLVRDMLIRELGRLREVTDRDDDDQRGEYDDKHEAVKALVKTLKLDSAKATWNGQRN